MKKLLYIGACVALVFVFTIPCFAIDNTFTQLDFVPIDEAFLYDVANNDTYYPTPSVVNNGMAVEVVLTPYTQRYHRYQLGVFGDGDYLFRAQGMSLYVLCLDIYMFVATGTDITDYQPHPIQGTVKARFLKDNGSYASSWVQSTGTSNDGFTHYFTFVLRETSDLDIYGIEVQFQPDYTPSGILGRSYVKFQNFGWKYSTGVTEVQEAIAEGVDVLVYGDDTLNRLQALGYESFDQFVSYEEIFLGYVQSDFDENYFANLPPIGYANGFLWWRILSARMQTDFPIVNSLVVCAIAVGIAGALFGLIGKAASVRADEKSEESAIHLHYHDHRRQDK